LPLALAERVGSALGDAYWRINARRRATVIENLLPVVSGDPFKARSLSRELFRQFAGKMVDLWRYESGLPIDHLASDLRGWEHFVAAQRPGRGVLLVTAHIGNWELGAPLLARRGVNICVITLQEPEVELTELRKAARARWGIRTLVIGENPFAFVDVIRELDRGTTVALLMDRPPLASAALVQFLGRPFHASVAAAELARASGCALLPVCLPRTGNGYRAEVLPEIRYDRATLGQREARLALTQEIMCVFEPLVQEYASQWFHFVPIWPQGG
jgi:KDO2-lipid IV(A) lauroyltransferase